MYTGPNIVTDGLVLALDAANRRSYPGSGTTWADLSGNANNGSMQNNVTYNSADLGYMSFDGVDDYVNCGTNSSISLTGDMSICSWVYFTSFSGFNGIISKATAGSIPASYDFYTFPSNPSFMRFYRGNGAASYLSNDSLTTLTLNTWLFVAVTMTGINVVHYLNEKENGTGTITATLADLGTNMYVGNRLDLVTDMNGRIASVQLYNRGLSASEVLQNYNATKTRFGL